MRVPAVAAALAAAGVLTLLGSPARSPASALGIASATPTPCALPPPLTCTLPTPLPSSLPAPGGGGSTSGGGGGTSGGSTSTTTTTTTQRQPPLLSQAGATPLVSVADQALIQSELADPALVGPLLAILQNPVSAQRPDLVHFDPRRLAAARPANARPALVDVARAAGSVLALFAAIMAALPLLGLGARRLGAVLLIPALLASGLAVAVAFSATRTHVTPAPLPDRASAARRATARARPAAWLQLVALEARIRDQHRILLEEEMGIASITQGLTQGDPQGLTPASDRAVSLRLASLVARHDADQPVYDTSLQEEYDVYRAAAVDPVLAAELRAGAARTGGAAPKAVNADLQILATQLQQETAIAAAESKLQSLQAPLARRQSILGNGAFIPPVGGPIGQPFGPTAYSLEPPLEYHGAFYPHFHTGIDIDAPLGTPVVASAGGVVALVASSTDGQGHLTGYGNYIVIEHPHGYLTLYGHLERVLVSAGQLVAQGQPVGLVGSTGNSTGPHLHFEIRRDGDFLDPLPYVTGALKPS